MEANTYCLMHLRKEILKDTQESECFSREQRDGWAGTWVERELLTDAFSCGFQTMRLYYTFKL